MTPTTRTAAGQAEVLHLALLRLFVVALYRPLVRPLTRRLIRWTR